MILHHLREHQETFKDPDEKKKKKMTLYKLQCEILNGSHNAAGCLKMLPTNQNRT